MEDLLHSLSEADRVCRKANEYFEAAGSFENEAENLNEKLKGLKKK